MDKYLIFRLEKQIGNHVTGHGQLVSPCFELVNEFEIPEGEWSNSTRFTAEGWAYGYSLDNKIRTVVVKGTVFEG
jgi:hypothetical protein